MASADMQESLSKLQASRATATASGVPACGR